MPDNIPISPGQGAVIATDQNPATGAHYQRVKLTDGTEASSDPIVSDGKSSLQVRTADEDLLKGNGGSVQINNDLTQPVPVMIDRTGRTQVADCIPVVLATDHDPVPVTSGSLPLLAGFLGNSNPLGVFGPVPLNGCNGLLLQVAGNSNVSIIMIFEATLSDPIQGPWVTVSGTRTADGRIDTNPTLSSSSPNLAWDFMLAGFTYFRVRVTTYNSGSMQLWASRFTNATEPTPSVVAQGTAAVGSAIVGPPVLVGGTEGTGGQLVRALTTSLNGEQLSTGGGPGTPASLYVGGSDGSTYFVARPFTVAPPGTLLNGAANTQTPAYCLPTALLIGGTDGMQTAVPYMTTGNQIAQGQSPIGTARMLLTDATGILQVNDSYITQLRQELRETNALLLLILQALGGSDMLTGKDGLLPQSISNN